MTTDSWRLGHHPALDGVRGLAVVLVIIGHGLPAGFASPAVGVNVFFVLSGFLITSLLWEEWKGAGRIDVAAFYRRRVRRLVPAFAAVSAVTFFSMVLIGQGREGAVNGLVAASYLGNLVMAAGHWLGPLSHTWSLAIEEQFYVAWPLLLLVGVRRARPAMVIAALVVGTSVVQTLRTVEWAGGAPLEVVAFATHFQADGVLLGCALGLLVHARHVRVPRLMAPIALGVLVTVEFGIPTGLYLGFGNTLAVLAGGLLVAALVASPGTRDAVFENRWLRGLGVISYGLYLWHYPVMWHLGFFDERPYPGIAAAFVGVAVTVVAALTSYVLIERPLLRRRGAARATRSAVPAAVPAAL